MSELPGPTGARPEGLGRAVAPQPGAPRVLVVAGEASGDLRGAELVRALCELVPDVEVFGIGGAELRRAGMRVLVDSSELSAMGLTELSSRWRTILASYRRVRDLLRAGETSAPGALAGGEPGPGRPDLAVLIDFPDFNLRLAKVARRAGVPVLYYVSPQVWAWRRYRVRTLARRVDHLAVVFPFEADLYRGLTEVTFVGHPALETVHATRSPHDTRVGIGLDPARPLITLLPGSRAAEIKALLPAMLGALEMVGPHVQAVIALADEALRPLVEELSGRKVPVVSGDTYNLVAAADLVLLSSGTATLETALLERPMVIMYRLAPITYALARLLVRVPFIGMPNLILNRRVVPELIQRQVTPARIAREARAILEDPLRAAEIRLELGRVRALLGAPGAAGRAAEIAARMLESRGRST
ncbi:MAG TPA: lipid-A-disaccharide synthase [Candidatus Bathyarchaeia archaeon]|nr:lipid-A-disaccharide synthase [Candidatus Bathyarchaeia archaeon]